MNNNNKYFLIETTLLEMPKDKFKELCSKYPRKQIGSGCIIRGEFNISQLDSDEFSSALDWIFNNSKAIIHGVFPFNY